MALAAQDEQVSTPYIFELGSDLYEYFSLIISSVVGSIFHGNDEKLELNDATTIHCREISAWKSNNMNRITSPKLLMGP